MLGVQSFGLVVLCIWGFSLTWFHFKVVNVWVPIRSTVEEEETCLTGVHQGWMTT